MASLNIAICSLVGFFGFLRSSRNSSASSPSRINPSSIGRAIVNVSGPSMNDVGYQSLDKLSCFAPSPSLGASPAAGPAARTSRWRHPGAYSRRPRAARSTKPSTSGAIRRKSSRSSTPLRSMPTSAATPSSSAGRIRAPSATGGWWRSGSRRIWGFRCRRWVKPHMIRSRRLFPPFFPYLPKRLNKSDSKARPAI